MRLSADALAARRGDDIIFQDISFRLTDGDALVLSGRNGSGKSTLLRIVAGLLRPEAGTVTFIQAEGGDTQRVSEFSHYFGHRNAMKNELTVTENLNFWRSFLGTEPMASAVSIDDATGAVGLGSAMHIPFGYLSAGQQRRLAFAKLLITHRPIWLLDEPTAALDTSADQLFADLITEHRRRGGIVVAATHQPLELSNVQELRMKGFALGDEGNWGI